MKNKDGIDYDVAGNLQLEGDNFTIIKLKNKEYVAGFITRYAVVPTKSLSKEMEPNAE